MTNMVKNYNEAKIPIDIVWSDLDYMEEKAIFTLDKYAYPADEFSEMLEEENVHWVPLIDVGVYLKDKESINAGK